MESFLCRTGPDPGLVVVQSFPLNGGGVFKTMMKAFAMAGVDGAGLICAIADGQDVIKVLAVEFVNAL